jgi:hypothetical protein
MLEAEGVTIDFTRLDIKRYGWSPRNTAPQSKKRKRAISR